MPERDLKTQNSYSELVSKVDLSHFCVSHSDHPNRTIPFKVSSILIISLFPKFNKKYFSISILNVPLTNCNNFIEKIKPININNNIMM